MLLTQYVSKNYKLYNYFVFVYASVGTSRTYFTMKFHHKITVQDLLKLTTYFTLSIDISPHLNFFQFIGRR